MSSGARSVAEVRTVATTLVLLLTATLPLAGSAQVVGRAPCPPLSPRLQAVVDSGWAAHRAGRSAAADSDFRRVLITCPQSIAAAVGAGYAAMRMGNLQRSAAEFDRALRQDSTLYDAIAGRGILAYRLGDLTTSRSLFLRLLRIAPGDTTATSYLGRLPEIFVDSALPAATPPPIPDVGARTGNRIFEVPDGRGGWRPFWVKAVNIGAALPGRHPSEFPPDDGTYERWLALIASMGANTVRIYTIHPPHFYRALRDYNKAHADQPLRIIAGVWTELPPGRQREKYDDAAWKSGFRSEMRRVIDVLHGHATLAARAGHASGRYDADVSPWTLGYIIGREWEPFSVAAFAKANPQRTNFHGQWLTMDGGNAVDAWLAEQCDYLVGYEMQRFGAQHPIAYTNWPTLDPLRHPTESTLNDEAALLAARHELPPEPAKEFDNDTIGLDAALLHATARFHAGVFASYHAYPYYPDFMNVDPAYRDSRSPAGPSHYYGYVRALVEHHGSMPVIISEYGVPSSRGVAHLQSEGWNHGGHSEQDQAAIDARLTRDIHDAGAAGAGLFALIDEWFKKNWIVIDFEQPLERNRLWLNVLDAEQNYGIIAMRAGAADSAITIDGAAGDWAGRPALYTAAVADSLAPRALRELRVASDEAYVYLLLRVGQIDWSRANYTIGIDSYDRKLGDRTLPYTRTPSPVGLEFAIELRGPAASRLLVDHPYNPYRWRPILGSAPRVMMQSYNPPFRTVGNTDGRYDTLRVVTNRRRIGRDGTVYPAIAVDRNLLRYARQDSTTLADWYADTIAGMIELRIPWGMLQVLDPSSRRVLYGNAATKKIDGVKTDGFRFVVESYDPSHPSAGGETMPARGSPIPTWSWNEWEQPRWHPEVKPVFAAMKAAFDAIATTDVAAPVAGH